MEWNREMVYGAWRFYSEREDGERWRERRRDSEREKWVEMRGRGRLYHPNDVAVVVLPVLLVVE